MSKKLKNILLIVFIIILFIAISFTNGANRKITLIESIFSGLITLPQKGYVYAKNWIVKDSDFFNTVEQLKVENAKLKEKNDELNAKLMNYEVIVTENNILKEHVNLIDSYPDYEIIVADIINLNAVNNENYK